MLSAVPICIACPNHQPAMQNANGSLNDPSAASALDAVKLSFDAYTNITQDIRAAITVSAQAFSLPGRRYVDSANSRSQNRR